MALRMSVQAPITLTEKIVTPHTTKPLGVIFPATMNALGTQVIDVALSFAVSRARRIPTACHVCPSVSPISHSASPAYWLLLNFMNVTV
jgi:hypothetical protein